MHSHFTEVRFASLLSGGFTTMVVINPPERKLAKRTSVHCFEFAQLYFGRNQFFFKFLQNAFSDHVSEFSL